MSFDTLKVIALALNHQQKVNLYLATCLIEFNKKLPADESRTPVTEAIDAFIKLLATQADKLADISVALEKESGNAN